MNKIMDIHFLIEAITPLYNQYKKQGKTISGTNALEIMWEIGDILKNFVKNNNIAPHNLYRLVYGKSEGTENIDQKSYISREFQGRCYRIREIFFSKDQIKKDLPNLKNFNSFREAMPFFDNKKYKLYGNEKDELLRLLNSSKSRSFVMHTVRKLQKEKIGTTNPRTQRLKDLEKEKEIFISFYNLIYKLLNEPAESVIAQLKKGYILVLAKNTNALSQDGLKFFDFEVEVSDSLWGKYSEMMKEFINQKSAVKMRRFRKIISPQRIVQLADMLYKLTKQI